MSIFAGLVAHDNPDLMQPGDGEEKRKEKRKGRGVEGEVLLKAIVLV